MPYANNNGVRIHYHVEGQGIPLVLQHGAACTFKDWYTYGYVEALKMEYRLILVDARGHGKSDKPHDSESYALELRAGDIVAVLDDINIDRAHYFGYSMGGRIGYGLAKYASERFNSLILGGQPYESSFEGLRAVFSKGADAFAAMVEDAYGPLIPEWKARLYENDFRALIACMQDLPSMEDILPDITIPCLLHAGESDPSFEMVKKAATQIPNAKFFSLPGLDHVQANVRSDLVLPHIKRFLVEIESNLKAS